MKTKKNKLKVKKKLFNRLDWIQINQERQVMLHNVVRDSEKLEQEHPVFEN